MANAANINSEYWEKRAVADEAAERKLLEGMTEAERIGYLAAKATLSKMI